MKCINLLPILPNTHEKYDIAGTSASAAHFQAMLLDGISRWNADREADAVGARKEPRSYSGLLKTTLNDLSQRVLGSATVRYDPPRAYTGKSEKNIFGSGS